MWHLLRTSPANLGLTRAQGHRESCASAWDLSWGGTGKRRIRLRVLPRRHRCKSRLLRVPLETGNAGGPLKPGFWLEWGQLSIWTESPVTTSPAANCCRSLRTTWPLLSPLPPGPLPHPSSSAPSPKASESPPTPPTYSPQVQNAPDPRSTTRTRNCR
jgi:hypothetical protein